MTSGEHAGQWRPVDQLRPPARTARTHSAEQIAKLRRSIRRFGFCAPILITADDEIVVGWARWEAARAEGIARVPTFLLDHLTPAQVEAYRLADNRLAEDGGWDEAMLANVVRDLEAALSIEDIGAIGYDADELARLLGHVTVIEAPTLPTHDRAPFRRTTFVLHDTQATLVDRALVQAKAAGPFVGALNENSNGNALARICATYLGEAAP